MKVIYEKMRTHSKALAPLAGALGMLFIVLLTLSLSQSQSLAEPVSAPAVEKTVSTAQAGPGDTLTYTIHAWRDGAGEPIAGAWLTDTVVDELDVDTVIATYGDCGYANGVVTWTGDLGEVWITFTAQISSAISSATITNTAEITGAGTLVTSDPAVTTVSPAYLEVVKTVSPPGARPGQQLAYTVYIVNSGNGTADSTAMTDELPEEVDWAGSLNATGGDWGAANNVITWTGSLAPLEAVTITFTANISSTLDEETDCFTNTAVVTGAGLPVSGSVKASVVTSYTYYLPISAKDFPPIIDLDPIPTPGSNNDYTVSWEDITSPNFEHYVLQESTSPNFSTYTQWVITTTASRDFTKGTSVGTFYYRVRVDGTTWGEGPWSNVESITVGFYDDFDDDDSGWPDEKIWIYYSKSEGEDKYIRREYKDGNYRIQVDQGGPDMWFRQPDALAPYELQSTKYCVVTEMKVAQRGWWCAGGLIFGANDSNTKLYMFFMGYLGNGEYDWNVAINKNYEFPGPAGTGSDIKASGTNYIKPTDWNKLQVSVNGDHIKAYMNGHLVAEENLSGLSGRERVGLFGGDYEYTPVDYRFKYFKVIENMACP